MYDDGALMLTIFGRKITIFRKLAVNVMSVVTPFLSLADQPLTAKITLPWDNFKGQVVNL